jgi:hypothetical protein
MRAAALVVFWTLRAAGAAAQAFFVAGAKNFQRFLADSTKTD